MNKYLNEYEKNPIASIIIIFVLLILFFIIIKIFFPNFNASFYIKGNFGNNSNEFHIEGFQSEEEEQYIEPQKKHPGDSCDNTEQCHTGVCDNNKCTIRQV
tara:strand:+ start:199 stop:501 length:303 start_codon:yes stop_codon:yes gene_type:complete